MARFFASRDLRGLLVGVACLALCPSAPSAQGTQYAYDALGRLVSAIDHDGKTVAYTYDNAGNRTRLSNGAEFVEIVPTAFTASSNAGTTGLTVANGMADGVFTTLASTHATTTETGAWIRADLGSVKKVNHIDIAPAEVASVTASAEDLNGTVIEYSPDGMTWLTAATVNGLSAGAMRTISLGGVSLRSIRIRRAASGQVALGDLRLFSAAAANSPLIAEPDNIVSSGAPVMFDPMTNDRDQDGHAFTITSVENPPHGTAVINAGASITYTPDAGYFGADSFLYTIADGFNGTASARVSVLVRSATNHAPVAVDDDFVVGDRMTSLIDRVNPLWPLNNDYDADADTLTITTNTNPAHGTATLYGGTVIGYQPSVGYTGSDTFNYTVSDGRGMTASAAIHLVIGNASPIVTNDAISTLRNTAVVFDPKINDVDPNGDVISITAITAAASGVATLYPNQTVTYAPNLMFTGADNLRYTLTDARGQATTGTINVTVAPPPFGLLEVMQPHIYGANVAISGGVFSISTNSSANVFAVQNMSSGKHYWEVKLKCGYLLPGVTNAVGVAKNWGGYSSMNAGIYTPAASWWSTTSNSTSLGAGVLNDVYGFALDADAKTLRIYKNNTLGPTINLPFNGPYFAHSGAQPGYSIAGQTCAAGVAQGEFLMGSGATAFTPPSGYAHVSPPTNVAPVALADDASLPSNTWINLDPKGNDLDQNGDTLSYSANSAAAHGVVANHGSHLRYTPTSNYVGPDSFAYTVTDGRGGSSTATVSLLVTAAGAKSFSITPAVSSKTSWNLAVDGPLNLSAGGTWTIVPIGTFTVSTKTWGGGGGGGWAGGAGGYAAGTVKLDAGQSYTIHVGGFGVYAPTATLNGGGRGGGYPYRALGGGGYSGIRRLSGEAVIIGGGGGGGGWGAAGGAGGGASGLSGSDFDATALGGAPGTQTSGYAPFQGGDGAKSDTGGGGGGGGYYGGSGGGMTPGSGGAGGGGGSGYLNAKEVVDGTMAAGSGTTPGNGGDADRAGSGQSDAAGRVIIGP